MQADRWQRIKNIFAAAVDLDAEARGPFLRRECAGDAALWEELDSLLKAHAISGKFIEQSAVEEAVGLEVEAQRTSWIGRRVGVYRITEEIGRGGMSEVYKAIRDDDEYHKEVAVKVLRSGFDSRSLLERFRIEKQILATLEHPNIARLLDGGRTEEGLPYLVMDYIRGRPIDDYCADLDLRQRLQLFLTLCNAVQYVHQHLMVHGDLKCSNVLVADDGAAKLLDFGVARLLTSVATPVVTIRQPFSSADPTPTALVALTPEYASPEQIRGGAITTASDVYSLGVVLFRLLTGTLPHRILNGFSYDAAARICEQESPLPSATARQSDAAAIADFACQLAGDLDNIVLMALQKDPARRYQSVEELTADLGRHLGGFPVRARAASVPYRFAKFMRRNRAAVAAVSILMLTLVGGIIATSWMAHIASMQRARAERRFDDMRALARSLVFELHDAIKDLPGATAARKLIIDRSLEYLDRLAQESSGDASLQRELASAFERLGNVQGQPTQANVGDASGALISYRRALALRKSVLEANSSGWQDKLALAQTYRLLGQGLWASADLAGAMESADMALRTTRQLAKESSSDVTVLTELERDYDLLASVQGGNGASGNLGNANAALDSLRDALATAQKLAVMNPQNRKFQSDLAHYAVRAGDAFVNLGERTEAMRQYRVSLETLAKIRDRSNAYDERLLSIVFSKMGDAAVMDGQAREGLRSYQEQLTIATDLASADPQNQVAALDLAAAYANVGNASVRTGDAEAALAFLRKAETIAAREVNHDALNAVARMYLALISVLEGDAQGTGGHLTEALQLYRQASRIYQTASDLNQQDLESRGCLAGSSVKIAGILAKLGHPEDAAAAYEGALKIAQPLISQTNGVQEPLYALADALSGLGDLSAQQAVRTSSGARLKYWRDAKAWYEQSASVWQRIHNPGALSPTGFSTQGPLYVTRRLAECNRALERR